MRLAALDSSDLPLDPADVLDWYDGPVTAVVRARCGGNGFLELLEWDRAAGTRTFALAGLEPEAFAVYRRDVERGSCNPGRLARETEALHCSAGPVERLVTPDGSRSRLTARAGWSVWR